MPVPSKPWFQPQSFPSPQPRPSMTRIYARPSLSTPWHRKYSKCWDMHSAPVSCIISTAYTVNCLVGSSISGIYYCYLCYLLWYFGLFLFLFVYKDIHYVSYSHASVHTLLSICHTVSYKSDMRLAFLFTDFSTLLSITVSLFYYAVHPLSLVFSHWYLTLSKKNNDTFSCIYALLARISTLACCTLRWFNAIPLILTFVFTLVYTLSSHPHILLQ